LAGRIRAGDTDAMKTALSFLEHKAELNGYAAPKRVEATGKDGIAHRSTTTKATVTSSTGT
jgi:hypothetical protein